MPVEKGRPCEMPRTPTRQRTASAGLEKNCVVRYGVLRRLLGQLCSHAIEVYVLSDFFLSQQGWSRVNSGGRRVTRSTGPHRGPYLKRFSVNYLVRLALALPQTQSLMPVL